MRFLLAFALVALCLFPPTQASAESVCQGPPTTVAVTISSTGTTQLVALSGNTTIYVCSLLLTMNGTTPGIQFEYGTGTNCATGLQALTGVMAPTTGSVLQAGALVQFQTLPGNALCAVASGTTPSIQGYVTYVQR
jgi:hypothetical protein